MKKKIFISALAMILSVNAFAQKKVEKFEKLDITMFPKAKEGYKQVYIQLPIENNENDLKVLFDAGTEKMVDCNQHSLMGEVKKKDLDGWGYSYYEVESNGETSSTKMGCPNNKTTKKYVSLGSEIANYNSRLPMVFYVPKNFEVRYTVLRPDPGMKKAVQK